MSKEVHRPWRPWLVAVVATLAMTVSYLDRQTLAAIAPTVRDELAISHTRFGWLGSAFAVAYLIFAPVSGRVVDRIGPKRALAIAVLAWSVVSAAHALASSFVSLFVLRALLGVLESPSFPAAARTIRTTLPANRRSLGMGLLFTGSSFGAMIAAPLAVRIARDFGFRYAFVVTAAVGLAWLPAWLYLAPSEDASADRPKAATESTSSPFALMLHPAMVRQALIVLGSAPAILVVISWFPQFMVEACHVKKDEVGHYLWLPPLVFDVAAVSFGLLASLRDAKVERSGPDSANAKNASHSGLVVIAALFTATLVLAHFVEGPWARVALGSLSMAGGAGMYVIGTADMLRRVEPRDAALASGLSAAVQSIVHVVANPLVGAVVDRTHAWGYVLAVGLLALPCAVAWIVLPGERRPSGNANRQAE